ncbi:MAG TPA: Rossmann-like and DUF2520 domain-containing protein [Terriglobales bacterium]|nr:Rossmann-like and DUF2520 domain-containing protein [Terriglobales bacterium]
MRTEEVVLVGHGRLGSAMAGWLRPRPAIVRHRDWPRFLKQAGARRPALLIFAIPDDAIEPAGRELAAARADWRGWTVLHTSGAVPSAALAGLRRRGAALAGMHPMMTFPPGRKPSPGGIVVTLEGDAAACRRAAALVRGWGAVPMVMSARQKAAYHLTATLVGPGAVAQFAAAERILKSAGLSAKDLALARRGLLQLLTATADNLRHGTAAAWTGPFARGDSATVARHWKLLPPSLRAYYAGLVDISLSLLPSPRGAAVRRQLR